MATFKVGQRVRIVKTHPVGRNTVIPASCFIGMTATVVQHNPYDIVPGYFDAVAVAIKIDGHDCTGPMGNYFWTKDYGLEPLQPDRVQSVEWSECVWQPEHMRESA